ncbi:hypothetical protein KTH_53950 [Thermosporothrix hazakensis]|nr:hypothetical protein KTH_53950 [Thermosporothrix hazakensis]
MLLIVGVVSNSFVKSDDLSVPASIAIGQKGIREICVSGAVTVTRRQVLTASARFANPE